MPVTLFDIQRKYGDSVYPLYKDEMHEPFMENEPSKTNMRGVFHNKLITLLNQNKTKIEIRKTLNITKDQLNDNLQRYLRGVEKGEVF